MSNPCMIFIRRGFESSKLFNNTCQIFSFVEEYLLNNICEIKKRTSADFFTFLDDGSASFLYQANGALPDICT